MKYTDNMQLLLFEANDTMNTNDFVNQNNQKIDQYTADVKATAEEANAGQKTANDGITEINGKIQAINKTISDSEVVTLPQFKTDTDDRLESLEDSVNSFLNPKVAFNVIGSEQKDPEIFYSGGVLHVGYHGVGRNVNESTVGITIRQPSGIDFTNYAYKHDFAKVVGNPFNLKINKGICCRIPMIASDNSGIIIKAALLYYNGVDTLLAYISDIQITNISYYAMPNDIPYGMYNEIYPD